MYVKYIIWRISQITMLRVVLFWCSVGFLASMAHVTFTNLKCSCSNKSIGEFTECRIKAVNRTHKYITLYTKVKQRRLNNVSVNLKLFRNDHGYKPFFVDITIDACKYLKNQNNFIANLFYDKFKEVSNMNHTCPYDHDIIVDKIWTGNQESDIVKYFPAPVGDYIIALTFYTYNLKACHVEVYVRKTS